MPLFKKYHKMKRLINNNYSEQDPVNLIFISLYLFIAIFLMILIQLVSNIIDDNRMQKTSINTRFNKQLIVKQIDNKKYITQFFKEEIFDNDTQEIKNTFKDFLEKIKTEHLNNIEKNYIYEFVIYIPDNLESIYSKAAKIIKLVKNYNVNSKFLLKNSENLIHSTKLLYKNNKYQKRNSKIVQKSSDSDFVLRINKIN